MSAILIVDDDVDTCSNLADIFNDLGYASDTAHDGPAALELVRRNPYRAALLDYLMPGMDGLTLCREIRSLRANTIAVIITAYAGQATPDHFLGAGASLVLRKPVDVRELVEALARLCGKPSPT